MSYEGVVARVLETMRAAASRDDARIAAIQAICEERQFPYGEIWMRYAQSPALYLADAWHRPDLDMAAFVAASRKFALAPGVGLPGRVWQSRTPESIIDIRRGHDFSRRSLAVSVGLRYVLGLPIIVGEDVIAVLLLFDVRQRPQPPGLLDEVADAVGAELARRGAAAQEATAECQQRCAPELFAASA